MNIINKYGYSGDMKSENYFVGRIVFQSRNLYKIICESGEIIGEVSGKYRFEALKLSDYPAVGDYVYIDRKIDDRGHAIIHKVLPRKTVFIRKTAGKTTDEQVVASNIDTVFICISVNNDFNVRRLERYLAVAYESGAVPVVVLTKSDLADNIEKYIKDASDVAIGVDILNVSVKSNNFFSLKKYLVSGKTVAFIGSSGVGKSTLINNIIKTQILKTSEIRNDDKGRHTTTGRQLLMLENGAMVIDTPGMRELGMMDSSEGIEKTFSDIDTLIAQCRFFDCTHTNEPGCVVREALKRGDLPLERWEAYKRLKNEAEFNQDKEEYLLKKKIKFKEIAKINKGRR